MIFVPIIFLALTLIFLKGHKQTLDKIFKEHNLTEETWTRNISKDLNLMSKIVKTKDSISVLQVLRNIFIIALVFALYVWSTMP
tara:strand:+ start:300 stop:551 length:252 start_codon:yes stop_codon:yes gene_type:complete